MKAIKADLSSDFTFVEIYPFADWHLGDINCDFKHINEQIEAVKSKDNAFCILNGDICNNATKTSVSDVYSESIKPMEQMRRACEIFEPIKDKILIVTQGNHEARTYKNDGVDITGLVCRELGIDDKYVNESGVLFLRFGYEEKRDRKLSYSLYVTHGSGAGGRKEGGKVNRLADLASIVDTDIYIMSHTHLPVIMREAFYRIDYRNSAVAPIDKLFINTGATLDYGGYGQTFSFKPSSKAQVVLRLSGRKKWYEAQI